MRGSVRGTRVLIEGLAICLICGALPALADPPVECCLPCGTYGDGSDGDVVLAQDTILNREMNYRNLTVEVGVTLNTAGYTVRVCGTLTNYGVITDIESGGHGGGGGAGGLGANPMQDAVPTGCPIRGVDCTDGETGFLGEAIAGPAGDGGQGGGGGGGGGGAWYNPGGFIQEDADGGNGGAGGSGGRGGGYVRIYALHLDNYGVIHADGEDGEDGEDAPNSYEACGAEYKEFLDGVFWHDLAGGGGGGGAGGNGGEGDTVEVHCAYLDAEGEIHALGGAGGEGGAGGLSGTSQVGHWLTYGAAPGGHSLGCAGGSPGSGGQGGRGADTLHDWAEDGQPGTGVPGTPGTRIVDVGFTDCNNNSVPDECDIASGTSSDCNTNLIPDECDIASGTSSDCNSNGFPDECELDAWVWPVDLGTVSASSECTDARAYGVNDDVVPSVVGQSRGGAVPPMYAFHWRDGTMAALPLPSEIPAGSLLTAMAVNQSNLVAGVTNYIECVYPFCFFVWHALVWRHTENLWEATVLAGGGEDVVHSANDVNNAGQVVGESAGYAVSWIKNPNTGQWVPTILGPGAAYGINESGDVVAGTSDENAVIWIWNEGAGSWLMIELGPGVAYDVNNAHEVVGELNGYAAMWPDPINQWWLATIIGPGTAYAINEFQDVVGESEGHAFVWTSEHGMSNLNDLVPPGYGWELLVARGINESRRIVGWGTHVGYERAFIAWYWPSSQDCNNNGIPDECDISGNTSCDCNSNGVPDECDIEEGISPDCNGNVIPDECEVWCNDCNLNGIPDECDIANNPSLDAFPAPDGNGFLDECDQRDCNINGLVDWCDINCDPPCNVPGCGQSDDCNLNGIPDECDLDSGPAGDCNSVDIGGDGVPDECCSGDSNCDGVISWRDIDYFVAAMNDNIPAWKEMFKPCPPTCSFANNDVNDDGTVNWQDIDPFVALMNTTCP